MISSRTCLVLSFLALNLASLMGCDEPEPEIPMHPDLDSGWTEFNPGGDTSCARDTPYAYWATPGTQNKLVVDFWGGGACWNDTTCSIADAIFEDSVDPLREAIADEAYVGIYDRDNEANPFKDWYHVVIPYCTGDVHWGNAHTRYGPIGQSFEIDHVGAINSRAVLDWVFANFREPEQIVVTGCSAGSYGSALWSAYLMEHYPTTEVLQFGDSGAGVITEAFFAESFPSWNAEEAFPAWIPSLDPSSNEILEKTLADLYAGVAAAYPGQKMAQYNTLFDRTQVFYFEAMGGEGEEEWSSQMLASIDEIEERSPNFCSFIAPGDKHCIVTRDDFYTVESDGVLLVDWLEQVLAGDTSDSVRCVDCGGE